MRRIIRLTEQDLHRIIKKTLNEVQGWTLEKDDVTWVNDEESGDKPYMVRIWPGSGYYLPAFGAYAFNEEHALECVVAYLEKTGNDDFFVDDYIEELRKEMTEEGYDEEEIDTEIDSNYLYVDATMEGANEPHYIFSDNLAVYPYKEENFKPTY